MASRIRSFITLTPQARLQALPLQTQIHPHPLRPISTTPSNAPPPKTEHDHPRKSKSDLLAMFERTILRPERAETAHSGTDNAVGDDHYAYDPSTTNPESEFRCFEEEVRHDGTCDPLFISPANREFSRMLDREIDGRAVGGDRRDRGGAAGSVRGWVNKHKRVKVRGVGEGREGKMDEYERLLRGLRRVQMGNRDEAFQSKGGESRKE
ncbi:uncharacterized protein BJX67DRAFT_377428 [Aspergillus lucknowensis]|uniref:Uncharacterized protein n=1 Tax=Aspergillus lucknowensis TaxID=176173 RepID=A0ABR4M517_9EURO